MVVKPAKDLWSDYLFLSREMVKFLTRQDFDMFFMLADQREQLQGLIDTNMDEGFKQSAEGQNILECIRQENQTITNTLKVLLNRMKQEQTVSQAYDPYNALAAVGRRMNRES